LEDGELDEETLKELIDEIIIGIIIFIG